MKHLLLNDAVRGGRKLVAECSCEWPSCSIRILFDRVDKTEYGRETWHAHVGANRKWQQAKHKTKNRYDTRHALRRSDARIGTFGVLQNHFLEPLRCLSLRGAQITHVRQTHTETSHATEDKYLRFGHMTTVRSHVGYVRLNINQSNEKKCANRSRKNVLARIDMATLVV